MDQVTELEDNLNKLEEIHDAGFIIEADYLQRKEDILKVLKAIAGTKYDVTIKESTTYKENPTNPTQQPTPTTSQPTQQTQIPQSQQPPSKPQGKPTQALRVDEKALQPVKKAEKLPVPARPFIPASSFVYSVSLVVMPPPEFWGPIVEIKKNHMNPRIKRPPYPHITLIQPFVDVPYFDDAKKDLSIYLQDFPHFTLNFSKFELFENRGSSTLFLNPIVTPPNSLDQLYETVSLRYPEFKSQQEKPSSFEPHIGVGYFKNVNEARNLQKKYQTGWKPISFTVQEIYVMHRKGQETPFEVRRVIPLGRTLNKPHFIEKPI